jgi:prephenate dehydrogenase
VALTHTRRVQVAFLGLGQIGGSVARALAPTTAIRAWTPSGAGPAASIVHGIEAARSAAAAIRDADVIVLAAPPLACLELLDELAGPLASALRPGAVITDVASTKAAIVSRARHHGLRYVGGHPMAGREAAGYASADPAILRERPWVLVHAEPADPAADERIAAIVTACGSRPVWMDAGAHDTAVAAISHAPLVLSAALVEAVAGADDWADTILLAAGGWASMTRLAGGDPTMGAGILATNGPATATRLRAVRDALDQWIGLIEDADGTPGDTAVVEARLAAARSRIRS